MADALTVKVDLAGLNDELDGITKAANEHLRPAAQAGAQVFYEEVLARVPVNDKVRKFKSGRVIVPGALKASIYQAFSADNSSETRATYHISWNHIKAPHGHLVENGTSRAPAHPFIRPAYDAVKDRAVAGADAVFAFGMQESLK